MLLKFPCFVPFIFIIAVSAKRKTEKDVNIMEFKSCSCDLTGGSCDIYCCCDQDCSEFHKQAFQCPNETHIMEHSYSWRCSNIKDFLEPEIHPLLCIEKENSPYLGLYFENFPVVKDLPSLNSLLNSKHKSDDISTQSLEKITISRSFLMKPADNSGYVFGKELFILKHSYTETLLIPHAIYGSQCDMLYPVQYLKDISSVCIVDVKNSCTASSLLDFRQFLIGKHGKKLLGSVGDDSPLEDAEVAYFYYADQCCYVKNCSIGVSCNKKLLLSQNHLPLLIYNGHHCNNSVSEAKFVFTWSGGRIYEARLNILLQNISVENTPFISQYFSVEYSHTVNDTIVEDRANMSDINKYFVHGSYEFGNPVVGLVNNTILSDSDGFEDNATFSVDSLFMWKSDLKGFCTVDDHGIRFGMDKMTGCYFKIPGDLDCVSLRSIVLDLQSKIFGIGGLSSGRNPEYSRFVDIQQNLYNESDVEEEDGVPLQACSNIPNHVHLKITYAKVLDGDGKSFYWIIGAQRSYATTTWTRSAASKGKSYFLSSTVKFKFVSMEEERLLTRVKRFWLPDVLVSQCKEESCWVDILFPLTDGITGSESQHRLQVAIDSMLLVFIIVLSSWFLFKLRSVSKRTVISIAAR